MRVKYKVLLIGSLGVLLMIILTYVIFNFTYFGYINEQQEKDINRGFEVIDFLIHNEKENLKTNLRDWAYWDDTYQFVESLNEDYIDSNLMDATLETLDLNIMAFFNSHGDIVYSKALGLEKGMMDDLMGFLSKHEKSDENTGLLLVRDKVFIISIANIIDSNNTLPSRGSLVFIRELDEEMLSYIQAVADVTLKFHPYDNNVDASDKIRIGSKNNEFIEASRGVRDIDGNYSISAFIVKELKDYKRISYYFNTFVSYFLLFIGVIIALTATVANKYFLKRLYLLDRFMNTVAATKDTTLSLQMPGRDEFYQLADSINKMLVELDSAYTDLREKDNRFRIIMEATNDGFLDYYVNSKEVYISPEWRSVVGYTKEDGPLLFHEFTARIHPECVRRLKNAYKRTITGAVECFAVEYRVIKANGEILWVQQRGKIAEKDEHGRPIRVVSTLANITDRKQYEEEILFLSYSDKLTGLKNRAYMEKQLEKLDEDAKSRYFIIIGDLNGLKMANDSIGHLEGDKLLCAVSNAIQELCEKDDIVSRWGGDEFVVLIREKDREYVSRLINKIREAVGAISEFHFTVSIALGYAEKGEDAINSEFVMSLAEKRMYRNKLMENKSSRNATISSLLRTLHEKHSETEEHTMRIKNLSLMLGKRIGLSQEKLDEIELLSLLHDIGKIGISEHILMKPSALTKEEWEVMKGHTEIGYRIAESTPELSHIAYEILCHHEKYDGTGYPNGLRGEEIPILARIINVIDSYDVMTHKRVYKAAMSAEYAVEELKRCSGTQFDPSVVDEFIKLLKEM